MQRHAQFFSSLKQVEKRLKLENHSSPSSTLHPLPPPPPPPPQNEENIIHTEQTDSLGSPIYLDYHPGATTATTTNANTSSLQESEVPREFLTNSPDFPPNDSPPLENHGRIHELVDQTKENNLDDDIVLLMQLLGLSHCEEPNKREGFFNVGSDDGFYGKIIGMKGPKNGKEFERLEGWINHFFNGEKREPFRLGHLLLSKAIVLHSENNSDDFGGFEFPSTIDEFLQNDPPTD